MTDANIISNYLQGIFWANLGLNMFNTIVSEKVLLGIDILLSMGT